MKTRLVSRMILWCALALGGSLAINGCKTDATPVPIQDFGAIRVLNFAESDLSESLLVPLDIFIDPVGVVPDSLPKINGLAYGVGSVYMNNLPAAEKTGTLYHLRATPIGQHDKTWLETTVTLMPGQRFSWVIIRDTKTKTFSSIPLTDGGDVPAADALKKTYVRFINLQPGSGSLDLKAGNSVNTPIGTASFPNATAYSPLGFNTDTSYTFFVTPTGSPIFIARIGFVSFAPGSFHTIIYSGDTARNVGNGYKGDAIDSLRIRIFDDNASGADMTNPIPSSLRYNIVNGIVPSLPFIGKYDNFGFAVNKDQNPKNLGFTFLQDASMSVFPGHSASITSEGVVNVTFAGGFLTPVVELQGFLANPTASGPAFMDIHVAHANFKTDAPVSIILTDTVQFKSGVGTPDSLKICDSSSFSHFTVPLPDLPDQNNALLVFANGISYNKKMAKPPFSITPSVNGTVVPNYSAAIPGRFTPVTAPVVAAPGLVTLTGFVGPASGNVNLPMISFTAVAGAIYEVVVVGQKGNPDQRYQPHFLVIRTNP